MTGRTVVLGLGNPLMGDDGAGIAALERLREGWEIAGPIELVDGGTWGMNLLPLIETSGRVVLVDAIRSGSEPGTITVLERAQLPRYFSLKISPHQIDLREVLAVAELRGALPEELVAVGIEPERVELDDRLSEPVAAGLASLVERVVERLELAGHRCRSRRVEPQCTS